MQTFFTKNGRFDKKLKPNLGEIVGIDEIQGLAIPIKTFEDKEIQCQLSIQDDLKLSIDRSEAISNESNLIKCVLNEPSVSNGKRRRAGKRKWKNLVFKHKKNMTLN